MAQNNLQARTRPSSRHTCCHNLATYVQPAGPGRHEVVWCQSVLLHILADAVVVGVVVCQADRALSSVFRVLRLTVRPRGPTPPSSKSSSTTPSASSLRQHSPSSGKNLYYSTGEWRGRLGSAAAGRTCHCAHGCRYLPLRPASTVHTGRSRRCSRHACGPELGWRSPLGSPLASKQRGARYRARSRHYARLCTAFAPWSPCFTGRRTDDAARRARSAPAGYVRRTLSNAP